MEYKIQIKKLIEYRRIITMTEEKLTKKSIINAEQTGSSNLLDDVYAIKKAQNYLHWEPNKRYDTKSVDKTNREKSKWYVQ